MTAAPRGPMNDELVIDVRNDTRYHVDEAAVVALARAVLRPEGVTAAELGIGFIGELRMRSLNRAHLGDDQVTDVLAFPLEEPPQTLGARAGAQGAPRVGVPGASGTVPVTPAEQAGATPAPDDGGPVPRLLGDVVVCLKQAERQAGRAGLPLSLETAVLLVHGILHVLGYDHERDAGRMALRQAELLESLAWDGLVAPPPA